MPARPSSSPEVGRRLVLGSAVLIGALALPGCGVRLEEDAPDLPFLPRRVKVPGESVLLTLLTETLALAAAATTNGSDLGRIVEPLHRTQASVLQDALLRGGVPSEVVTKAVRAVPASPGAVTDADLAAAERQATNDTDRYAALAPELARPVIALLAQRRAAATLLTAGGTAAAAPAPTPAASSPAPTPGPTPSGTASSSGPGSAADAPSSAPATLGLALTAALQAADAFEVIQARSPDDAGPTGLRARAAVTTTWLRSLAEDWTLQLGTSAPEVPVAIALPFPVTSPEDATKLAAEMLARLRTSLGRHLGSLAGSDLTSAWQTLPPTLADVEIHAHGWGVPLEAFPGLP